MEGIQRAGSRWGWLVAFGLLGLLLAIAPPAAAQCTNPLNCTLGPAQTIGPPPAVTVEVGGLVVSAKVGVSYGAEGPQWGVAFSVHPASDQDPHAAVNVTLEFPADIAGVTWETPPRATFRYEGTGRVDRTFNYTLASDLPPGKIYAPFRVVVGDEEGNGEVTLPTSGSTTRSELTANTRPLQTDTAAGGLAVGALVGGAGTFALLRRRKPPHGADHPPTSFSVLRRKK